jgi:hypothetical protein
MNTNSVLVNSGFADYMVKSLLLGYSHHPMFVLHSSPQHLPTGLPHEAANTGNIRGRRLIRPGPPRQVPKPHLGVSRRAPAVPRSQLMSPGVERCYSCAGRGRQPIPNAKKGPAEADLSWDLRNPGYASSRHRLRRKTSEPEQYRARSASVAGSGIGSVVAAPQLTGSWFVPLHAA